MRVLFGVGQYPCVLHRVQTGSGIHTTLIQGSTGVLTTQIKQPKPEAYHSPSTLAVSVRSYAITPSGRQVQQFRLCYYYYYYYYYYY